MLIYSFCLCRFCSFKTLRDVKIEIEKGARCEHKADRVVLSQLIETVLPEVRATVGDESLLSARLAKRNDTQQQAATGQGANTFTCQPAL